MRSGELPGTAASCHNIKEGCVPSFFMVAGYRLCSRKNSHIIALASGPVAL
ncbi:hypothetical protein LMG23994_02621 [Cupriavidus pinatubonensis]|uniref:Uncharacterized protein n=1 Tax=Cupriavidus pinatubonensis TaxID=248026 RepID=A0ABN7YIP1_9BURK|nr:hypothetical protein LMG23994_02621 [Cupriavidus pinatubonensis]